MLFSTRSDSPYNCRGQPPIALYNREVLSQVLPFDGSVQHFHSISLNVACKGVIDHYYIQANLQISDQGKALNGRLLKCLQPS